MYNQVTTSIRKTFVTGAGEAGTITLRTDIQRSVETVEIETRTRTTAGTLTETRIVPRMETAT